MFSTTRVLLLLLIPLCSIADEFRFHGDVTAYEDEGFASIVIERSGPADLERQVTFTAAKNRAEAGKFVPTTNIVTFPAGVRSASVAVTLVNDNVCSQDEERVTLRVSDSAGSSSIGFLRILEDDPGLEVESPFEPVNVSSNGLPARWFASYFVNERQGVLTIPLKRLGRPSGVLRFTCLGEDVTALNGTDYDFPTTALEFGDGVTNLAVDVPILDTRTRDGRRTFRVVLNSQPEVQLAVAGAEVSISDDETLGWPGSLVTGWDVGFCSAVALQVLREPAGTILVLTDYSFYESGVLFRMTPEGTQLPFAQRRALIRAIWITADEKIYAGGVFFPGYPDPYLIRLNHDGTLDSTWTAQFDGQISQIVPLPEHRVLILGSFTTVNGRPRPSIVVLKEDGSDDPSFQPTATFGGFPNGALLQPDGSLLAFGLSASENGRTVSDCVRLFLDGKVDFSFQRFRDGKPFRLSDSRILLDSGSLTAWMPDGAQDPTFVSKVNTLLKVLPDRRLIVSWCSYPQFDGTTPEIGRLFEDGSVDESFYTDLDSPVYTVESLPGEQLAVGGCFSLVNGLPQRFLTKLDLAGSFWTPSRVLWNGSRKAVSEGTVVECTVLRDGDASQQVAVRYSTVAGSAVPGEDFAAAAGEVVFAPGERAKQVLIRTLPNRTLTPTNKVFSVALSAESPGMLGANTNLTVTILDREIVAGFAISKLEVSEAAGLVSVSLARLSGLAYPASFEWSLDDGNGNSSAFVTNRGTATFSPLSGHSLVGLKVIDDGVANGPRKYTLRLSSVTENVELTNAEVEITVLDNDLPGFAGDAFDGPVTDWKLTSSGEVLACGDFRIVHGEPHKGLVKLNSFGRVAAGFRPPDDWDGVYAVLPLKDDTFIAAISRRGTNGSRCFLQHFSENGVPLPEPTSDPLPAAPVDLGMDPSGRLYVVGVGNTYNGVFRDPGDFQMHGLGSIVRYHADGRRDTNFSTKVEITDARIFFDENGSFWLGGAFQVYSNAPLSSGVNSSVARKDFARFKEDGSLDLEVNTVFNNSVKAVARATDGKFLVAGCFTEVNDQPYAGLVRLTAAGVLDPQFRVSETNDIMHGAASPMLGISITPFGRGGAVIVASSNPSRSSIHAFDANGAVDEEFGIHEVHSKMLTSLPPFPVLSLTNDTIFVGGGVETIDGVSRSRFARLFRDGTLGTQNGFSLRILPFKPDRYILDYEVRDDGNYRFEQSANLSQWEPLGAQVLMGRNRLEFDASNSMSFRRLVRQF